MDSTYPRNRKGKIYDKRRKKLGCLSGLLCIIFVFIACVATIIIFFRICHIRIIGSEHYSIEEIRQASGVDLGDNLLLFDKIKTVIRIFSRLPYVDEISVWRDLPDTLVIEVTECTAIAYFSDGDRYWFISSKGKILEQSGNLHDAKLIRITGVELIDPEVGEMVVLGSEEGQDNENNKVLVENLVDTLSAIIKGGISGDVGMIDLKKVYNIEFTYLNRFLVKLGMPADLDYKISVLGDKILKELEPNEKGTIDLSELVDKNTARFVPG